jgi:hypothetical protein
MSFHIMIPILVCAATVSLAPRMAAPRIRTTSAMHIPRMAHSTTSLADGRVLVAGGFTSTASAEFGSEIFDAATKRFVAGPRMHTLRFSHSATLLADGRVLVAGGYGAGNTTLASAEIFDPRTNRFTTTGSMRTPRADHAAVRLRDGRVLFVGGVSTNWTFLASAELFDPATGLFTPVGSMRVARESHATVLLHDGAVLVIGGHRDRRDRMTLYASVERFDPATGQFADAGTMRIARHKHDAVLLHDGRVLIVGGSDTRDSDGTYSSTEIYDPRTRQFTDGPAMRYARYKHEGTSVLLASGHVVIAGGAARAEVFDPVTNRFSVISGDAELNGQFSASAALPRGDVLITGGYAIGRSPTAAAWVIEREPR